MPFGFHRLSLCFALRWTLPAMHNVSSTVTPARRVPEHGTGMRNAVLMLIAMVSGLMLGMCWLQRPTPGTAILSWILWTLILLFCTAQTPRSSGIRWYMAGFCVRFVAFHWIPGVVAENFEIYLPVAWLFFIVMIAFESLTWLLLGVIACHVFRFRTLSIWIFPSLVIILDQYFPRVFPWSMGHLLIGYRPFVQMADFGGTLGVTWYMTIVSCVIVNYLNARFRTFSIQADRSTARAKYLAVRFSLTMLALLIVPVCYGIHRESQSDSLVKDLLPIRVAAVQVDSSFVRAEEKLRDLSLQIKPTPELVVWPESSLGVYSDHLADFKNEDEVYELSREPHCSLPGFAVPGTALLACAVTFPDHAAMDGPYRNTSLLIDHNERIIGKYVKRSLLPFGEYVPGQSLLPTLRHFANIDTVRESGNNCQPMVTGTGLKIGGMICYDDINPANARETVAAGAQLLTVQVNAADYDNPVALRQHCLLAVLRAVENRRYFIRCASTGVTCIISPWGEMLAECEPQTEAVVTGIIFPLSEQTFYTRFGDWPVGLSLLCLAVSIISRLRHRIRPLCRIFHRVKYSL